VKRTRNSRPVTYVAVDNRDIRSESPNLRPICIRKGAKDAPNILAEEVQFFDLAGNYLGRIGYWPDDPIMMEATEAYHSAKGVTVWVEFDPERVILEPTSRSTDSKD
jgi:hypothetical protein